MRFINLVWSNLIGQNLQPWYKENEALKCKTFCAIALMAQRNVTHSCVIMQSTIISVHLTGA